MDWPAEAASSSAASAAAPAAAQDAEPAVYEVNVKSIDGTTTRLEVPSDLRGADLKELICERTEAPVERQRLIFRGKVVKDEDLIGQHITESGQTLHMVQRPGPPPGAERPQQPSASSGGDGPGPGAGLPPMGTQVHFQFAADGGGGVPMAGMPQVDLSQLLGTVFGAMNPAAPAPAPPAGPPPAVLQGAPPPPPPPPPGEPARPGERVQGNAAAAAANAAVGPPQPVQILFQQGLGNWAQVIPMLLSEAGPPGEAGAGRGAGGVGAAAGQGPVGQAPNAGDSPADPGSRDMLPWRDLRRLTVHLARLLGRPSPYRTLPPASMPAGEWHSFLSVLLSAVAQLGVALGDLQASLVGGAGAAGPRYRLQLAMALVAAARTLRVVATTVQSEVLDGFAAPGVRGGGIGGAGDAAAAAPPPQGAGAAAEPAAAARAISDSEEDVSEQLLEPAAEAADVVMSPPAASRDAAAPQPEAATGVRPAAVAPPTPPPSTQLLQMLPQLFGQLSQPPGAGGSSEVLDSMPPEVGSAWRQWTQPQPFRRVLSQALQPPFSEAYISGDATGSHRSAALPPPSEFLQLRWRRSAGRVEGLEDVPEPPEHLSRAYLSAILRDLGRHVGSSTAYSSIPDAQRRYPHLAQLAATFSAAQAAKDEQGEAGPSGAVGPAEAEQPPLQAPPGPSAPALPPSSDDENPWEDCS